MRLLPRPGVFCIAAAFVLPLFYSVSIQNASGGVLWGSDFSGTVSKIDPDTGDVTPVFQFPFMGSVPRTINALGYDPSRGRIVGSTGGSLFGDPIQFFQFNPFAVNPVPQILGTYTPTAPTVRYVSGMAFDRSGNLFLSENNRLDNKLVRYDLTTMTATNVYDLPRPANFNVGGLETIPSNDEVLGIHASSELVFSIGLPNGPLHSLGSFSQSGFTNAFAYDSSGNRYFLSDTRLIEFDPISGDLIRILSDDNFYGLAYVNNIATTVPEPTSVLMFAWAFVHGVLFRRRRRNGLEIASTGL